MELSDLLRIFEKDGATWSWIRWIDPENWYSKPFQHQMAQWLLWGGAEEPSEGFTAALAEALWQNALSSFVIYHKPLLRSSLGDAEKVADLHLSNRSLLQPAKAEGKNQGCILIDTLLRSVEWGNSPTGTWIAHFKDAFSIIVHSHQEGKTTPARCCIPGWPSRVLLVSFHIMPNPYYFLAKSLILLSSTDKFDVFWCLHLWLNEVALCLQILDFPLRWLRCLIPSNWFMDILSDIPCKPEDVYQSLQAQTHQPGLHGGVELLRSSNTIIDAGCFTDSAAFSVRI